VSASPSCRRQTNPENPGEEPVEGEWHEFPTWALDKFMKGLNEGIKAIEDAKDIPKDLRSIKDYVN
jgi:hypothetical protein